MIFGVCIDKNESTTKRAQLFLKNQKIIVNKMMRKRIENQISKMKMSFTFVFSNTSFSSIKVSS
jgi:hypothetical protein